MEICTDSSDHADHWDYRTGGGEFFKFSKVQYLRMTVQGPNCMSKSAWANYVVEEVGSSGSTVSHDYHEWEGSRVQKREENQNLIVWVGDHK